MKTGSASYGIDFEPMEEVEKKWYRWKRFPLLPIVETQQGDEYNTSGFQFSWLNVRAWSMNSFNFAVEFHLEDIGCFLRLNLPYLNIYLWLIPFPESWHQRLWRKPPARFKDFE